MNKTPLAFFVGGAVTCAILLAIVTRDRLQGQPSAVQTAATGGQTVTAEPSAPNEVKTATEQSTKPSSEAAQNSQQEVAPSKNESAKQNEQVAAVEPKAEPAPEAEVENTTETAPEPDAQKATEAEPVPDPELDSTSIEVQPAQSATTQTALSQVRPAFDIISVAPDGLATISGRAEPGAEISVMLDDKLLGSALTNDTKTWHLAPEPFLPSGDHNLTATATMPDGKVLQFAQNVTVAIDENAEKQPLIVLSEPSAPSKVLQKPEPEPKQVTAALDTQATQAQQPAVETQTAETPPTEIAKTDPEPAATPDPELKAENEAKVDTGETAKAEPEPAPEKVANVDTQAVAKSEPKALQKSDPEPVVEAPKTSLVLDTVDYNDAGNIIFSGKSEPGGKVRIYVDGKYVGDALADATGSWVFKGNEDIKSGLHQLRIDQVQSDGKVVQRRELPFERADPAKVAEFQSAQSGTTQIEKSTTAADPITTATTTKEAEPEKTAAVVPANGRVVIQPGNNLWNISRVIYGKGIEYTAIYEANKDQIRDPDRIYPGQIFATPGTVPPEEIDPSWREPLSMEEKQTQ